MSYIDDVLAEYGASYNYETKMIVNSKGAHTGVTIKETPRRLELRMIPEGKLIMSGGKGENTLRAFVEKYWYWEKLK